MAALVAFAVTTWKLNIRSLSCVPSPFGFGKPLAQPRSNAVMIGQNRQAALEQAKADHDYTNVNNLLVENTELTRSIHGLTEVVHTILFSDANPSSTTSDPGHDENQVPLPPKRLDL